MHLPLKIIEKTNRKINGSSISAIVVKLLEKHKLKNQNKDGY